MYDYKNSLNNKKLDFSCYVVCKIKSIFSGAKYFSISVSGFSGVLKNFRSVQVYYILKAYNCFLKTCTTLYLLVQEEGSSCVLQNVFWKIFLD